MKNKPLSGEQILYASIGALLLGSLLLSSGIIGWKIMKPVFIYKKAKKEFASKNFYKAIGHYKVLLEEDSDLVKARYELGLSYIATGQTGKAKKQIAKLENMGENNYAVILKNKLIGN